ncbi:acetylglutamate kinase [Putridiphycobacter roseus]|uniref:Acetylglutamate kinase n=1 Tax=Putridiphycobacter roseus TaxID=2219161 RepID=A0A2W1NPV4_9FLAO|nr:acetylglutamate kinase [Putridiphycobacter roseus]PZE17662.1 acetylglutamate kinase [Putridiphycobacter roseus]
MKNKLVVIKIGGNIIDDDAALASFLTDFSQLKQDKILIHGGGKIATRLNDKLGIKTIMNEGRRITSSDNLDTTTMVYAGLINKKIVGKLQGYSCNALGLSGSDANCILATKRPSTPIDFGWVGDVVSINNTTINLFLENNITPVFCALSHDGNGQLLNTNADTVAAEIAVAMSDAYDVELIYCFEKKGVLMDVLDEDSLIQTINSQDYACLKQKKIINEGMLPKMENCFYALNNHVNKVIIGNPKVISDQGYLCTTLIL